MRLLLIRHAAAIERSTAVADESRPLTAEGRRRFAGVVRGLRRLGIELDVLRHSPWTRAVDTANLLMPLVSGESIVDPSLARAPDERLLGSLTGERVALVGHQPWLGQLFGALVSGSSELGSHLVWKKGGVAWLEGDPRTRRMELRAFMPPRVVRHVR
jgi:phosphohistidine phosphatase